MAERAQVQRAFEAVQDAYAENGADGLARADADCAAALKTDPRVLDYCLAFELFAISVAPEVARAHSDAARLQAARAALPPGVDPAERIAAVRSLMRTASLGAAAPAPRPVVARRASPQRARPVRQAVNAPRHVAAHANAARADDRRREAARASVQALFARAEAARAAAAPAAASERIRGDPAGEAPH